MKQQRRRLKSVKVNGHGARAGVEVPRKRKPRRVKALQKFLKAYGRGEEGNALRELFAKRVASTLPYLVHLGYGFRIASPKLATEIEKHTHGLVRVEELRPDIDWAYLTHRKAAAVLLTRAGP